MWFRMRLMIFRSIGFGPDLEPDLWLLLTDQVVWPLVHSVLLVNEFELKCVEDYRTDNLLNNFWESLANAGSLAAKERHEGHWMSLLTRWSEIIGILRIESLWDELIRLNPLVSTSMQALIVDVYHFICFDSVFTYLCVFSDSSRRGDLHRRFDSQWLIKAPSKVGQQLSVLLVQGVNELIRRHIGMVNHLFELCTNFLSNVFLHCDVY